MKNLFIAVLLAAIIVLVAIQENKRENYLTLYFPRAMIYVFPHDLRVEFENGDTTLRFNSNKELDDYLAWIAIREQGIDAALHHDRAFITMAHVLPSVKKIPVHYWDGIKTTEIGYIMQVDSPAYHQYYLTETLNEDERKY